MPAATATKTGRRAGRVGAQSRRHRNEDIERARGLIGKTVEEILEEERRRHEARVMYRLRWHLVPHWITIGLAALAGVLWLVDWLTGHRHTGGIAAVACLTVLSGLGLVWLVRGRRLRRWRWHRRVSVATAAVAAWLPYAIVAGPSWEPIAALFALDLALAAGYWRVIRIPAPQHRPLREAEDDEDEEEVEEPPVWKRWRTNVACEGGPLPKSRLVGREVDENNERYTIQFVPGRQSLNTAMAQLDKVCSGLRVPAEDVLIEPHPSRDPSLAQLTIVHTSPIRETVLLTGPQYFKEGLDSWIEPGWYADGIGRVRIPVTAPNSVRNLTIIGGQGSGKSSLLNSLALSLQASGHAVIWYLDGQDGVSSPQLLANADWAPTGPKREEWMLKALECMFDRRGDLLKLLRVPGLNVSPETPAVIVIIDECHVFLRPKSRHLNRWLNLIRTSRKVGCGFWVATQHPSVESFGNEAIRSLLRQYTTIVMRTVGQVSKGILELDFDPGALPTLPGYGYVIGGTQAQGVRTAPFRADFLPDDTADKWFARYKPCPLDRLSATAAGEHYLNRHKEAEEQRRKLEEDLALLEQGISIAAPDDEDDDQDQAAAVITEFGEIPTYPDPPKLTVVEGGKGRDEASSNAVDAVYEALVAGATSPTEVMEATNYSRTQVWRALNELVEAGRVVNPSRGVYRPA